MLWSAVKCCARAHESLNAASMFRDCACPRIELWTTGWCADGAPMCRFSRGLWMLLMDILVFRFPLLALHYYPTSLRSMLRYIPGMLVVHHPEEQGSSIAILNRVGGEER